MKHSIFRPRNILGTLLLAAIVIVVLWLTNVIHVLHKSPKVSAPTAPITKLSTAQTNSGNNNANSAKTPTAQNSNQVNQGTSTDKQGQIPSTVSNDPSQWSTSSSHLITVETPLQNANFSSGNTVAGTADASIKQVQYTLIDNQYGVISQGFINVVNGKFSATVSFSSHSSAGRLDVYNNDANGREVNEVQINVNFP